MRAIVQERYGPHREVLHVRDAAAQIAKLGTTPDVLDANVRCCSKDSGDAGDPAEEQVAEADSGPRRLRRRRVP